MNYEKILKSISDKQLEKFIESAKSIGMDDETIRKGLEIIKKVRNK